MTTYEPVRITAHLETGISSSAPWGIALDGLLAAQLWAEHKAHLRSSGVPTPTLHAQTYPPDLDLPLARCHAGGTDLWHWQATTAYPVDVDRTFPPEARYRVAYVDELAAGRLARNTPNTVSAAKGRWRLRRIPTLVTVCRAVTWTAIGDAAALTGLLEPILAIGKRRGIGEGHVLRWEVSPAHDLAPGAAGHLHPDGSLARPTPAQCLADHPELADAHRIGTAGIRPPYMHRSRQHLLHLPAFLEGNLNAP